MPCDCRSPATVSKSLRVFASTLTAVCTSLIVRTNLGPTGRWRHARNRIASPGASSIKGPAQRDSVRNAMCQVCYTARDALRIKGAVMNLYMMVHIAGAVAASTIRRRVNEELRAAKHATRPRKHDRNRAGVRASCEAERGRRQRKHFPLSGPVAGLPRHRVLLLLRHRESWAVQAPSRKL
jgi:hypothetical protein